MKKIEQKNFRIEETLTDAHIKFFQKHCFLHFKNSIDKQTTAELLQEVANLQLQLLQDNVKKVNGIPLKFGNDIDGSPLIQRLAFTSTYSNKLSHYLKDNRLQSLLPLLEPYSGRIGENEKDGVKGLFNGKAEIIPGFTNKLNAYLPKFFPKIFVEKIAAGIYQRKE